jgi:DNA-binding Lrp family transcriptional regulator
VLDTLLRLGEPRSQTEIAEALGESQNRFAEVFQELLRDGVVLGVPSERLAGDAGPGQRTG